jgi:hypothetical protein
MPFDFKDKFNGAADKVKNAAASAKAENANRKDKKSSKPESNIKSKKKFAKYSNGTFTNAELVKPKYARANVPYVNIEDDLNAIAKANKIRIAISGSLGGILVLFTLGYTMLTGSVGFLDFSTRNFVTYPAFVDKTLMNGGFVKQEGVQVYASITDKSETSFFGKVQYGFGGGRNAVVAEIINLNTALNIKIQDGTILIADNLQSGYMAVDGVYEGGIGGDYRLQNEYLAKCISGSCKEGSIILLPVSGIIGVVS